MTKKRNKIIIPIVLLLGIFIGGVLVLRTKSIGATILTEGKKVFFPIAAEPDADPDNDGLKNWEEKIHKTDPRNPDTDGDGYLDGEEVASNYSPIIASPNDAPIDADTTTSRPLPQNLTTHLAQILAANISAGDFIPSDENTIDALNDQNIPYNQDVINNALAQIGIRAKQYFILPNITDEDITISLNKTTYQEIGRYINAVAQAVQADEKILALNMTEIEIIQKTVQTKNTEDITALLNLTKNSIKRVTNIIVPQDFVTIHKQQLAIFTLFVKIFEAVKNFQDDPALAVGAIETYPSVIDMLQEFSEELNAKIQSYQ